MTPGAYPVPDPPLTTIRQPVQAMGAAAVSGVVNAIEHAGPVDGVHLPA
ncbi:MAG: hypothetical protein R2734_08720 [Nocardioides sp.]